MVVWKLPIATLGFLRVWNHKIRILLNFFCYLHHDVLTYCLIQTTDFIDNHSMNLLEKVSLEMTSAPSALNLTNLILNRLNGDLRA